MNFLRLFLFTSIFANILFVTLGSSKEQLFYDAVRLESSGDYENAISNYKEALSHATSANLHGNLANLYYLTNDYGRSILHYQKALLLEQDNRDFRSNLAYVRKMAKVGTSNNNSLELNGFTHNFWKGCLGSFFWTGLLIICYLFFRRIRNKTLILTSFCWIAGNLIFVSLIFHSTEQMDLTNRKVVALNPVNLSENNSSANIQLRKFAAKSSSANSSVRTGETLIVDRTQSGELQKHKSQDSKNWLLVSTLDKRRKGWVLEEEIGWLSRN